MTIKVLILSHYTYNALTSVQLLAVLQNFLWTDTHTHTHEQTTICHWAPPTGA